MSFEKNKAPEVSFWIVFFKPENEISFHGFYAIPFKTKGYIFSTLQMITQTPNWLKKSQDMLALHCSRAQNGARSGRPSANK